MPERFVIGALRNFHFVPDRLLRGRQKRAVALQRAGRLRLLFAGLPPVLLIIGCRLATNPIVGIFVLDRFRALAAQDVLAFDQFANHFALVIVDRQHIAFVVATQNDAARSCDAFEKFPDRFTRIFFLTLVREWISISDRNSFY